MSRPEPGRTRAEEDDHGEHAVVREEVAEHDHVRRRDLRAGDRVGKVKVQEFPKILVSAQVFVLPIGTVCCIRTLSPDGRESHAQDPFWIGYHPRAARAAPRVAALHATLQTRTRVPLHKSARHPATRATECGRRAFSPVARSTKVAFQRFCSSIFVSMTVPWGQEATVRKPAPTTQDPSAEYRHPHDFCLSRLIRAR